MQGSQGVYQPPKFLWRQADKLKFGVNNGRANKKIIRILANKNNIYWLKY